MLEIAERLLNHRLTDCSIPFAYQVIFLLHTRCDNELAYTMRLSSGKVGEVKQDYKQAFALFSKYASPPYHSRLAQCELGRMYMWGHGCEEDRRKAYEMFMRSAEQGYGEAMYRLGYMHRLGWGGVQEDCEKALLWYRRAVHYGKHAGAAWRISCCYENGEGGVSKSALMAEAWIWFAAQWGESPQRVTKRNLERPSPEVEAHIWEVFYARF